MNNGAKRLRYVLKRLLQAIPVVIAILVINFFLLHMAEGDAADVLFCHWILATRFDTVCRYRSLLSIALCQPCC